MIIGLTGTNASGKGTAAKYLMKKGFKYYSLSDELRLLLRKRKITATRENLIEGGRYYRSKHGKGYFAKVIAKKINGDVVVDSIRNLGEVVELRKLKDFILIAVDAPIKIRFQRARKRSSNRDQKTLREFIAREREELHGTGAQQQLVPVIKKADHKIINKSTLRNLYKKLDATLKKYDSKR